MPLCIASPLTVQPGQVIQVAFTTVAAPNCGAPCDTLIFSLGFTNNMNAASIVTADLFISDALVGTFQPTQTCLNLGTCAGLTPSFVAAGSLYGLNSPVVDFTSILNGPAPGVLDIVLNEPIEFDPTSSFNELTLTHAVQQGNGVGGQSEDFDNVVVLPEPDTMPLIALLLGAIAACRLKLNPVFSKARSRCSAGARI